MYTSTYLHNAKLDSRASRAKQLNQNCDSRQSSNVPEGALRLGNNGIIQECSNENNHTYYKRILNGVSPFTPDKNHIHHLLLSIGYSHGKATKIIILFSLLLTSIAYCLRANQTISFVVTVLLTIIISYIPSLIIKSLKKRGKIY